MDTKEKSLHLLGILGIVGEVFKIIRFQAKSLLIITLVSIVPPLLITLTNIWGAYFVYSMIHFERSSSGYGWSILYFTVFLLLEVIWATFFYVGLMPSITAVVYIVAGVYNGDQQENSIASLPTVWKRMLITSLWYSLMSLVIVVGFGLVLLLSVWILFFVPLAIGLAVFGGLGMYVTMVWHLSIVASVMEEECCGLEGMKRTRRLIQGKRATTWGLLMSLIVIVGLFNFAAFMGNFSFVGIGASLLYAVVYLVLASVITLMWEVTQSVLYFVCKAHHGDSIEIGGLSLEACPPIVQAHPSSGGNLSLDMNNYNAGRPNFLTS